MISDLLAGASMLVRGFGLVIARPRLFLLGGLPPLVTSILFMTLLITLISNLGSILPAATGFADGWAPALHTALEVAFGIGMVGGSVLIMVLLFSSVTLLIGSPAYDRIAEFTDQELGGAPEPPDEPVVHGIRRAIGQSLVTLLVTLIGSICIALLGLIPVLGQVLGPVLSVVFGGWMLVIELLSSSFERRGFLSIAERRDAMGRHRFRTLGFAVPTFMLLAIPFLSIVVFPSATAGATMLARDLTAADDAARDS